MPKKYDPLKPNASVLSKLGSIAVHADEMMSTDGHVFDKYAMQQLIDDPEVKEWIASMDKLAYLPKKRKDRA